MKILILEDDPNAMDIVSMLKQRHEVCHARAISDFAFYVEYEPGLNAFDKILVDATIPNETVKYFDGRSVEYKQKKGLNGCEYLIQHLELFEHIKHKIALRTAFAAAIYNEDNGFTEQETAFLKELYLINKISDNLSSQLNEFLVN